VPFITIGTILAKIHDINSRVLSNQKIVLGSKAKVLFVVVVFPSIMQLSFDTLTNCLLLFFLIFFFFPRPLLIVISLL